MFDVAVTWYLLLAGAGSGASLASFALDCLLLRTKNASRASRTTVAFGLVAGFALVSVGSLFLLSDLGRPERSTYVFLNPQSNVMTFGVFAIAAFLTTSMIQILTRIAFKPRIGATMFAFVRWACAISALAVLVYTGLLLESWLGVPFWGSMILPALFAVSGLSCGISLLRIGSLAVTGKADLSPTLLRKTSRIEVLLLTAEVILLAGYLVQMWYDANANLAVAELVGGSLMYLFWIGTILIGLVVPLLVNALPLQHFAATRALTLLCTFVGSFCLRYCVMFAPFAY